MLIHLCLVLSTAAQWGELAKLFRQEMPALALFVVHSPDRTLPSVCPAVGRAGGVVPPGAVPPQHAAPHLAAVHTPPGKHTTVYAGCQQSPSAVLCILLDLRMLLHGQVDQSRFTQSGCHFFNLDFPPHLSWPQAGLSALKTPLSLEPGCCREDPLHLPAFRTLAEGLPFAKHVHSKLICAISHTLMNEHNPPAALPNGWVAGQALHVELVQALRKC